MAEETNSETMVTLPENGTGDQVLEPPVLAEESALAEERKQSAVREYFESLLVTVILALFGTTFLIQAFKIPSSSMEDTLLIGDYLMVNKLAYSPATSWVGRLLPYQQIHRGDIVVFRYPVNPGTHFVKRVIGLPGDRLRIAGMQVIVNGHLLAEGYKVHKIGTVEDYRDHFPAAQSPSSGCRS